MLKSELAALDRKITTELAPKHDENDGIENKREQSLQPQSEVKAKRQIPLMSTQPTLRKDSRIIRIQRALSIMQDSPRINFAQLAYDCGYTDQSHMIKEFKQHSGNTPKEFLSLYNPFSDYFSF